MAIFPVLMFFSFINLGVKIIFLEVIDFFSGGLLQIWKKRLVFITNALAWLLVFGITALLLSSLLPVWHSLIFSLFHIFLLVITYYLNIYLVNRFIEKGKYGAYLALFAIVFALVSFFRISFNLRYFENTSVLKIPIRENWAYIFSVFSTLMVLILSFFYGLLINRSKKEKEYKEIISRQQEAQLQFLKAQMNPHFLFNTLNNIYSLTIGKAPKASEMLLLLSDLLRYAVYESKKDKVKIESEIKQIEKLIQLFQLKSEKTLSISFDVRCKQSTVFIEPMILIPLVENCFKHCNFDSLKSAYVSIRLTAENNKLEFETINTKDHWEKSKDTVGGVGLENIRQRLAILYPKRHTLDIQDEATIFNLKLTIIIDVS
jgi:two-component system, LytTR family, sensor kinase